jgi:hypothetical protein
VQPEQAQLLRPPPGVPTMLGAGLELRLAHRHQSPENTLLAREFRRSRVGAACKECKESN